MLAFLVLCNVLLQTQTVAHSTLHTFFPQIPFSGPVLLLVVVVEAGVVHRVSTCVICQLAEELRAVLVLHNLIFRLQFSFYYKIYHY